MSLEMPISIEKYAIFGSSIKCCLQFLLQKQYFLPPNVSYVICMRVNALVGSIWVPHTGHLNEQRVSKSDQSCNCNFPFTNILIRLINYSKVCLSLADRKRLFNSETQKVPQGTITWNGE